MQIFDGGQGRKIAHVFRRGLLSGLIRLGGGSPTRMVADDRWKDPKVGAHLKVSLVVWKPSMDMIGESGYWTRYPGDDGVVVASEKKARGRRKNKSGRIKY
jgi:hypothetical protein